jgi:hypothetical protein
MYNRIDRKWPGISAPKRHFFERCGSVIYQTILTLDVAPPGTGELRVGEEGEEGAEGGVEGAEDGVEGRERERREGGRPRGFEGLEGS